MPGADTPRVELARSAVRVIAAVMGRCADPVHVTVSCNGTETRLTVTPEEAAAILGPAEPAGLSVLATALWHQLSAEPRTAKALARAAGYSMGSHVYAALRELEGRSLCEKTSKGYRLRP